MIAIRGNDNFCSSKALVTAMARVKHASDRENMIKYKQYGRILQKTGGRQLSLAMDLCKFANVEMKNGCEISKFKLF